ncbi:MAG: cytochrome c oxidase subunit II [Acidimicrobiales bacterium]|nr:cytochrome c oxidase subunit II [Acidimicrobiales bacterium]
MSLRSADTTARSRRSPWFVLGLAGLVLVLAGCASNAPLDTFAPEGPEARTIMDLVLPVFLVAAVVFVLVEGAIVVIMWKFRQRKNDDDPDGLPPQVHGNTRLEVGWTVLPAVILAPIAVLTVLTIFDLEERDADAVPVEVVGNQWWWQFNYDIDEDGEPDIVTATEMVVPAGRQIDLSITSNDVVHSFWIPRLNGKRDAVPGRTHTWSIEADEPGYYWGQCTEFCGLSHAEMRMRVVALPPDQYDEWVQSQMQPAPEPQTASEARGRDLFAQLCSSCHRNAGLPEDAQPSEDDHPLVAGVAPDLTHFASRRAYAGGIFELYNDDMTVNRGQLEAWLRNPPAEKAMAPGDNRGMPNLGLTEPQIDDLVDYLLSTSPDGPVWTGPRND